MSFWIKSRKSRKHTKVKKKELNELSFKLGDFYLCSENPCIPIVIRLLLTSVRGPCRPLSPPIGDSCPVDSMLKCPTSVCCDRDDPGRGG